MVQSLVRNSNFTPVANPNRKSYNIFLIKIEKFINREIIRWKYMSKDRIVLFRLSRFSRYMRLRNALLTNPNKFTNRNRFYLRQNMSVRISEGAYYFYLKING